jgi:guanylate kinase
MAQLFVFSAPSGAGKTTIVSELRQQVPSTGYSISHTTRAPRKDETDGVHYHFVDEKTFRNMIDAGGFVEWAQVYGNYYGTSFAGIDEQMAGIDDIILDLDPQGAKNIRKHYDDAVLIYVLPPSMDVLKKRLTGRGTEDEKDLEMRFQKAIMDMKNASWYDYLIINNDLETAVQQACSIITSQRCRTSRQLDKMKEIL